MPCAAAYGYANRHSQSVTVSIHPSTTFTESTTHRIRTDLRIRDLVQPCAAAGDINHPVNNRIRHVHALRPKLLRERLAQRALRKVAGCERGRVRKRLDPGRRPGEDECWRVLEMLAGFEKREDSLRE